jgi:chromosome condensin MukBEF MukE localization factor
MDIGGMNLGLSDSNSNNLEQVDQTTSQSDIDLEKLAEKIYEKLIRELEIENERLGQA